MKKAIEGLRSLGLIDEDLLAWIESDTSSKRLLSDGQAPVDVGGVYYKVREVITDPIGTIIQLQNLRNYARQYFPGSGGSKQAI